MLTANPFIICVLSLDNISVGKEVVVIVCLGYIPDNTTTSIITNRNNRAFTIISYCFFILYLFFILNALLDEIIRNAIYAGRYLK